MLYLDDGCGFSSSLEVAQNHAEMVKLSLINSGFVINSTKSLWDPVHLLCWLGLEWDLNRGFFKIIDNRIARLLKVIDSFLGKAPYVTARECASITGHIVSMSPVLGNLTRLKSRYLYKAMNSEVSWNARFNIGRHNDALGEIFYWKNHIAEINFRYFIEYKVPRSLCFSDASHVACGFFLDDPSTVCHRLLNP